MGKPVRNIKLRSDKAQAGVVLFVCLIFILMMTMLAVTSIRSSTLTERFASNARDKALAFQAAEAALRKVETDLSGTPGAFTAGGTGGRYLVTTTSIPAGLVSAAQAAWAPVVWSSVNSTTCSDNCASGVLKVTTAPKYLIEQLPATALSEDSLVVGKANKTSSKIYRITAAATGTSDTSYVVLQSVYRKP